MSTSAVKRLTVDEFLRREARSEVRHEYFDGEIFAMAGGSFRHGLIAGNAVRQLGNTLASRGCLVVPSDVMVFCPTGLRTYPDVSVTCDRPRFEDDRERVLLNPKLIVEVLSESTEAYDRGKKFDNYQSIASLDEYVLISQDRPHVDRFTRRQSGEWLLAKSSGIEASVELPTLDLSIPLAELFASVDFEKPAAPSSASKRTAD